MLGLKWGKIMRACLFAVAPLVVAAPAQAAPVYLQCPIAEAGGGLAVNVDLTLNEDAGTAGYYIKESGYSDQGRAATFTPDAVRWRKGDKIMRTLYGVDRNTLEYVEVTYIGEKPTMTRRGICTIAKAQERKF